MHKLSIPAFCCIFSPVATGCQNCSLSDVIGCVTRADASDILRAQCNWLQPPHKALSATIFRVPAPTKTLLRAPCPSRASATAGSVKALTSIEGATANLVLGGVDSSRLVLDVPPVADQEARAAGFLFFPSPFPGCSLLLSSSSQGKCAQETSQDPGNARGRNQNNGNPVLLPICLVCLPCSFPPRTTSLIPSSLIGLPSIPLPDAVRTLPASVTWPAAAASLAWLNGKYNFVTDIWGISTAIRFGIRNAGLEKRDRINAFYRFEELALSPQIANRPFLIVPQDDEQPNARTEWTYAESYETILKYARWLKEDLGVRKEEIIAMDFKNKPHFIWIWFALWSLGAMPAFLNTNLRDNAFIHCVKVSTTRLLVLDPELREALTDEARAQFAPDEKGRAIETVVLDTDVEARIHTLTPYRAPDAERSGAKAAGPSILIYTSGTTGLPKAANVSWSKPHSGMWFFPRILEMKPEDRYFTAMPLYHSSASLLGVCQALGPGASIIIAPKFSPRTQMKIAAETKATIMQYIGEMSRYMVTSPPSSYDKAHNIRLAFGNGMRPDVWQKFKDRFNIPTVCEFYGATEGPGASFVYSRNEFYTGAIGRSGGLSRLLFGGNQVLIKHDHETDTPYRDPKTTFCVQVATNEPGELIYPLDPANIDEKFQGYYGNDKASSSKIFRDVFAKGDAYYRSGDLQRRDADGRWWFVDRIGDTYRWKGENVSTAEVAEALGSHPALLEANVYGIELPNHDGRAGCAAVALAEGKALEGALGAELAAHVRKRLPRYAVPLFLRVTKEFEVTGTMKHQKVGLRNQGVDPGKTGEDEMFWLPPGGDRYVRFGKGDWERISGGSAKL